MKKHTKIYLGAVYPNWSTEDYFPCELCVQGQVVDVHHIDARGMGGSKEKDFIENLMGSCRECHTQCESGLIAKDYQILKHRRFLIVNGVDIDDYYFETELDKLDVDLGEATTIFPDIEYLIKGY